MKRSVIQIADSTQLISLPRKWAQKYNIKKGDELDIIEKGNQVMISTGKAHDKGSITADVSSMDRDSLMYFIRSLYISGYDELTLKFKNQTVMNLRKNSQEKVMDVIKAEVSRLNGFEIFSQKGDFCVIKSISSESMKEFDVMLKRIFMLSLEAIKDFIDGVQNNDLPLLESIQGKHDSVTIFVAYCQRILHKVNEFDSKNMTVYFYILEKIDEVMDLVKYCARDILSSKINVSKESLKIYNLIHESFNGYVDLFYHFDFSKVYKLNEQRYKVLGMTEGLTAKFSNKELYVLSNFMQVLEAVLELTRQKMLLMY